MFQLFQKLFNCFQNCLNCFKNCFKCFQNCFNYFQNCFNCSEDIFRSIRPCCQRAILWFYYDPNRFANVEPYSKYFRSFFTAFTRESFLLPFTFNRWYSLNTSPVIFVPVLSSFHVLIGMGTTYWGMSWLNIGKPEIDLSKRGQ